jgi:hypothetical protein
MIDKREARGLRARARRQEVSIFVLDKIQGSLQSREQETELGLLGSSGVALIDELMEPLRSKCTRGRGTSKMWSP